MLVAAAGAGLAGRWRPEKHVGAGRFGPAPRRLQYV